MNSKILFIGLLSLVSLVPLCSAQQSVAREWNEVLLEAIRNDFARPTVHARNLWHSSVLMYDLWAVHDDTAQTYFLGKTVDGYTVPFNGFTPNGDIESAREESISYAMYRLLRHRFSDFSRCIFYFYEPGCVDGPAWIQYVGCVNRLFDRIGSGFGELYCSANDPVRTTG